MAKPKNIDDYLKGAEGTFAHPILVKTREMVNELVPDVKESIKWGIPYFEHHGLMVAMVKFKSHTALWFDKGALLDDSHNLLKASSEDTKSMRKYQIPEGEAMDHEGVRHLILEAAKTNEEGRTVKGFNEKKPMPEIPKTLAEALEKDDLAKANFEKLTDFKKKEYIEYINEAKQDATQMRRAKKALSLLQEGKGLHDKYR